MGQPMQQQENIPPSIEIGVDWARGDDYTVCVALDTYETVELPTRYRLKPLIVEAVRWTGESLIPFASLKQHAPDFPAHFDVEIDPTVADVKKARGIIHDADHYAILHYGDYVLLDQDGKMLACSAAMFAQVFEPYPEPETSDFQNRMIERYADKNFPGHVTFNGPVTVNGAADIARIRALSPPFPRNPRQG